MKVLREPELLSLIIDHAKALRAAGVLTLTLRSISVTLAPHEPEFLPVPKTDRDVEYQSVLDDPATYGGRVPGFPREGRDRDEERD